MKRSAIVLINLEALTKIGACLLESSDRFWEKEEAREEFRTGFLKVKTSLGSLLTECPFPKE